MRWLGSGGKGRIVVGILLVWFIFGTALAVVLALGPSGESEVARDGDVVPVRIGSNPLTAEVASTDSSRARGLGGRSELAEEEAMLFVFDGLGRHNFWMRGVDYPLDMIWIRHDRVAGITRKTQPDTVSGNRLYPSTGAIDRVLEVRGGWAARHKVRAGDPYRGP